MSTFKYTKEYLKEQDIAILIDDNSNHKSYLAKMYGVFYPSNDINYLRWNLDKDVLGWSCSKRLLQKEILASEVIADYEASKPKRNIIGYKTPIGLYENRIIAGEVYKKNGYTYDLDGDKNGFFTLPAEIVEQWEPVYEEEKPTFGSFSDIIKHFKGDTDKLILFSILSSHLQVCFEEQDFAITRENFNFTDSFQLELKELGIKI
jgi:hypothetical protein